MKCKFGSITLIFLIVCIILGFVFGLFNSIKRNIEFKNSYKSPDMVENRLKEYVLDNKRLPTSLDKVFDGYVPFYRGQEYKYKNLQINGNNYGFIMWNFKTAELHDEQLRKLVMSRKRKYESSDIVIIVVPDHTLK